MSRKEPRDITNRKRRRMISDSETKGSTSQSGTSGKKNFGFEHLDHPADIQLHSWASTMETAIEQLIISLYAYMIDDNELTAVDEVYEYYYEASGHDMEALVFSLLDEVLVAFQSEPFFIGKRVIMDSLDLEKFEAKFHIYGETYDITKHKQGTDVKAITYSNMQIQHNMNRSDLYVIIDI